MAVNEEEKGVNEGLTLLAKSSFFVFFGIIISKVLSYSYRIIIARYYGPEVYGIFSIGFMLFTLASFISLLGFSEGIVRYIAIYRAKQRKDKIKYLFKTTSTITLISGLISGIALFLLADYISIGIFHEPLLVPFLKIFSFLIPLWAFSNLYLSVIRAYERIVAHSIIFSILQNIVRVFAIIIMILLGFNTEAITFSIAISVVLVFLSSYFYCKYLLPAKITKKQNFNKQDKKRVLKNFLSYSLPMMFYLIVGTVYSWTDTAFLGYFFDPKIVGIYNAAVPLAILFLFVQEVFVQLFFPLISKEIASNRFNVVRELSKQVGKWTFIFNLPLLVFFVLFPDKIIIFFFGQEFVMAKNVLSVLSIGYFVSSISLISSNILLALGRSKLVLTNLISTTILNIFLNYFLILEFGIIGAAIATTISWIVMSLATLVETYVLFRVIPIRRKMFRILLLSFPPLIPVFWAKSLPIGSLSRLILAAIFYCTVYILLIVLFEGLDKNDLFVFKKIFKYFKNIVSHILPKNFF